MPARFVGRRPELHAIGQLVGRAGRARRPAAALIVGDPGSGKTRLLREAVASADGTPVVHVAGFEPTAHVPFAALGDLARRLAAVPEHGSRLESFIFGGPEAGLGGLPVFEAAHRALAGFGPLVVAVDDLQWVDGPSIALLRYVLRAAVDTEAPLTVIAASRPSPAALDLGTALTASLPEADRVALSLRGLALEDGLALVRDIDPSVSAAEAEELWKRADGSPFWLGVLAQAHDADGADLIAERLRVLSQDAAAALGVLVIAARPMTTDDAAAVLRWPAERASRAIRELETRGLVGGGIDGMRPTHDLIRESAARRIPDDRARRLHEALAGHLEASPGADARVLEEALDHRLLGGQPAPGLALRIIESPGRRLLDPPTLDRLQEAVAALSPDAPERVDVEAALARLSAELGQHDRAIRLWERVLAQADGARAAQAALAAARSAYFLTRGVDARAFVRRARELPLDETARIEADAIAADISMWLDHDTAAGRLAAERALARGESLIASAGGIAGLSRAAAAAILRAVEATADAALQQDRAEDVVRLGQLSVRLGERLGGEARVAALIRTAFAMRALRYLPEAERQYRTARELARELLLPSLIAEADLGYARVLRDTGRLLDALEVTQEALELERRTGIVSRRWGTAATHLRVIESSLGIPGAFERMRAEAKAEPDPHAAIGLHEAAAAILARRHGAAARADVEAELELGRAASALAACRRCGRELSIVSAEALARVGDLAAARRELEAWEADLVGSGYPARDLWQARAHIALDLAAGNGDAAAALERLVSDYEAAGMLEDAIWASLDLGAERRRRGDRAGAIAAFEQAAARAEEIHAAALGRLAARSLRELGVRAWRRSGASADHALAGLSDREREIAMLIAGGSSNREVADALVLSPKTVDRHMTNILAKVGARNRTELARLVHVAERPSDRGPGADGAPHLR